MTRGCRTRLLLAHNKHAGWQMLAKKIRPDNYDSARRVWVRISVADLHALHLLDEASSDQEQLMLFACVYKYMYIQIITKIF